MHVQVVHALGDVVRGGSCAARGSQQTGFRSAAPEHRRSRTEGGGEGRGAVVSS